MTSSVDSHTIPPFYACYLLRSYATSSSARTYIGSTPDPARRKKQHNGLLTQGAHKTKRGRPWETQMLVYGFPSKIAALQFEWAWQKPHMSRHLRTHPNVSETSTSSSQEVQQHIALPLFTDTPLNQIPIGEDGSKPLACSSVQTSLMVARALLKSEPFAGWGLRLIFFEEYLWSAWNKLQDVHNGNISIQADFIKVGLFIDAQQQQQQQQTRLRRPLPPLSVAPNPICDFAGVDGEKKNMLNFSEEERLKVKLDPLPPKNKSKSKASGKTKAPAEGRPAGIWPERLPVTLNVRNMGGTWALLEKAPFPPSSLVERGKKKAQDDSAKTAEGDLFTNETAKKVNRFHLDDEDVSLFAFRRFDSILESKSLSIEDVVPIENEDQCSTSGSRKTEGECGICKGKIQLRDHTSYTVCPSPFKDLRPKPLAKKKSSSNGSLSQYGFGNAGRSIGGSIPDESPEKEATYRHCQSIFHIRCLSECFLEQSNQKGRFLLPTHGFCPNCYPSSNGKHDQLGPHNLNTWNDIVRCTFRRKDFILKELKSLEVARLKAAKVAIQQAKKVRKPKAVESNGNAANTVMNTKAVTKKKTKKRSQEQNLRHGDSEDSDADDDQSENIENQVRIENTVPKSIKITHESLLSKLTNAIEGDSTSDKHSKSTLSVPTAYSVKRSIPSTWTPMTARTAPSDRTNILLDSINTVSSNFVDEEEDSLLGSDIDEGLSQKIPSKDNRMRRKPTPSILTNPNPIQQEVIDLT